VLGIQPYVDEQFYVGFKIGETELGLDPDAADTPGGNAGVVVYWAVEDVNATLNRLLELGATKRDSVQERDGEHSLSHRF
jgi:predicted enzyme related to lactoylglutathione lyase